MNVLFSARPTKESMHRLLQKFADPHKAPAHTPPPAVKQLPRPKQPAEKKFRMRNKPKTEAGWSEVGRTNSHNVTGVVYRKPPGPNNHEHIMKTIRKKHMQAVSAYQRAAYHAGHVGSWIPDEIKGHRDTIGYHYKDAKRLLAKLPKHKANPKQIVNKRLADGTKVPVKRTTLHSLVKHIKTMHSHVHGMYTKAKAATESKKGNWWDE